MMSTLLRNSASVISLMAIIFSPLVAGQDYIHSGHEAPSFMARPQEFKVPVGSDVSFPCEYGARGGSGDLYSMIFKYVSPKDEDRIYFAGDTKVTHFPRIKKVGPTFMLSDVKVTDIGTYVCRFETKPLTQIVHKLQVLYPPKVWRESAELQRVSQGSNVLLQCSAEGNPPPTITWTRKGTYLPSGALTETGFSMTLEAVDRHVEGEYICTADNGIDSPAIASMTIQVEYEPDIETEQSIIHTGEGDDAKLACVVHGRPSPDVTWLRGDNLVSLDKHFMEHDGGHRHTLTIQHVKEEDFGEYTCRAKNSLGKMEKKFTLTGLPQKPTFSSSPNGTNETSYTLRWATETSAPIVQYRLKYRKSTKWKQSRDVKNNSNSWIESKYFPNNENLSQVRQGIYQIKHTLDRLPSDQQFQAQVQVENKFGWSSTSDIFSFKTKTELRTTTTMKPLPETFNHGPKVEEVAVEKNLNAGALGLEKSSSCITKMFFLFISLLICDQFV